MAIANKSKTTMIYVRVPYCGRIHELGVFGPFQSLISKENIIMLLKAGYEVQILNKKTCPEFAKQLDRYYIAKKQNDIDNMVKLRNNMLPGGIDDIIENLNAKIDANTYPSSVTTPTIPVKETAVTPKEPRHPTHHLSDDGEILIVPHASQ